MEAFDPATVYSSIDAGGRYAYGNQPVVVEWNLARLAEALLPLLHDDQEEAVAMAVESLGAFRQQYHAAWSAGMRAKLGLSAGLDEAVTSPLVDELVTLLQEGRVDHTSFYRFLGATARGEARDTPGPFLDVPGLDAWAHRWRALGPNADLMDRVNPVYIPRNHLVEEALAAASEGDLDLFEQLLDAVAGPYHERPGLERYGATAPKDFGPYSTFCGT
jgi:uncharacterized protein YdiU (UPF0061 family)